VPFVLVEPPDQAPRSARVFKPMTTIGASLDTDIRVEKAALEPVHAQISREADGHYIVGMTRDMTVNGRREKRKRLQDRDLVRIGELKLTWYENEADLPKPKADVPSTPPGAPQANTVEVRSAYRRVHEFSIKLLQNASTPTLIETLLDAIIELTNADKGFLVLLDENKQPKVRAARNVERGNLDPSVAALSDSILKKVLESHKPVIVADALSDREFNASESVVNLKLLSVMCCPLLDRGELLGVIYVGNNRISNVFSEAALDAMNVFAAQASLLLSQARRIEELSQEKLALEDELVHMRLGSVVGASDFMKEVFKRVRKVATADIPVLITGETGTGKELIAREIHRESRRAMGPFVAVNCGAIPESLLESELFGHVRGAFTGAVANKIGRFQAANGGSLFLDEIGEMPAQLQVKLLRALQEHVVIRVGDTKPERVDIRVIAATNRVLEEEIKAGRFREDLYYRLNVVGVHLPPLRDRGDDLILLARYLLAKTAQEHGRQVRGFSKSCLVAMRKYRWPGNIRQLENRIKKAVVLNEQPLITAEDMDLRAEDVEEVLPLAEARNRFERRYIHEVLERNGGNRTKTARDLGVDPRTIFRHLAKEDEPIPPETGELGVEVLPEDATAPPSLAPPPLEEP
jgi:transcriptional regulator with GAF, ATPase, and Fis domain